MCDQGRDSVLSVEVFFLEAWWVYREREREIYIYIYCVFFFLMVIVLGVAIIMTIIVMSIILIASYCYVATSTIIPLCTNIKKNINIDTDMQGYPTILWMVAKSCTTKRMVNTPINNGDKNTSLNSFERPGISFGRPGPS